MRLYGIALLPNQATTKMIIKFQNDNLSILKKPKLSLDGFLPHTSILQCPYYPKELNQKSMEGIYNEFLKIREKTANFENLYIQPKGWYFLGIKRETWMLQLQTRLLALTENIIDHQQLGPNKNMSNYSELERKNYLKYGYRYVGKAYRPHITLGRDNNLLNNKQIDPKLFENGQQLFFNREFNYENLVFYEAGYDGALARIIEKKRITF